MCLENRVTNKSPMISTTLKFYFELKEIALKNISLYYTSVIIFYVRLMNMIFI